MLSADRQALLHSKSRLHAIWLITLLLPYHLLEMYATDERGRTHSNLAARAQMHVAPPP